jgi:two-component system C4-dicarboxylate transport sensor histidine kinase DctB
LFACALGVIGLSTYASQHVWRENGLKSLQAVNEPRLQLIANAINAEIGRQDHLPIVLSLDADVQAALEALGDPGRSAPLVARLNRKLARLSLEANTRAMFVIGPDGTVIASDDWDASDTLVGRNLADRPYFAQAVANNESSYLGIEPSTNRVRYYLAQAIRDTALRGVAVVRIEFDALEAAWEKAGEHVLVTDSDGVVFLSSDAAYRFHGFGRFESPMRLTRSQTDRYLGAPVEDIEGQILERRGPDLLVRITSPAAGVIYLTQTHMLPEYGWTIHRLTELTTVNEDQRDGAIIGGSLSALIIILVLYVVQRHQAFLAASKSGAELQRQVAERTHELSDSNASLHSEIEERRRTEARLRATQNELVQAGKLAALGQMSAAIAHEINQPLAAIRTFMASTRIFAQRGELAQVARNLDFITDLAERMASITGHLKTFARKSEPGHPEPVAVERAVERTLVLLGSQIRGAGVRIEKDVAPDLLVNGHAVQLEQVILNLVGNALDAVAGQDEPWIRIRVRALADIVAIAVAYGIVQDFGGQIHAVNRPEGGAELTVELPRHRPQTTALEKAIHA